MPSNSMSLAIHPRSLVSATISPSKYSPSMLFIAKILSIVGTTIRPLIYTFALNHVVLPLALESSSVWPHKLPLSLHPIIYPSSNIVTLIIPCELALSVLLACPKLSLIRITVRPFIHALPKLQSIYPFSSIFCATFVNINSLTMLLVISELSFVIVSIGVIKFSQPISFSFKPFSLISCAIGPFLNTMSMFFIIFKLSLILSTTLKCHFRNFICFSSQVGFYLQLFLLTDVFFDKFENLLFLMVIYVVCKDFSSSWLKKSRRTYLFYATLLITHIIQYQLFYVFRVLDHLWHLMNMLWWFFLRQPSNFFNFLFNQALGLAIPLLLLAYMCAS